MMEFGKVGNERQSAKEECGSGARSSFEGFPRRACAARRMTYENNRALLHAWLSIKSGLSKVTKCQAPDQHSRGSFNSNRNFRLLTSTCLPAQSSQRFSQSPAVSRFGCLPTLLLSPAIQSIKALLWKTVSGQSLYVLIHTDRPCARPKAQFWAASARNMKSKSKKRRVAT